MKKKSKNKNPEIESIFWRTVKPASRRQALREMLDSTYQPQLLTRTLEKWQPVREQSQKVAQILGDMDPDSLDDLCNPAWYGALMALDMRIEKCGFRLNRLDSTLIGRCFGFVHELDNDVQTLRWAQHSRCPLHLRQLFEKTKALLKDLDQWENDVRSALA